MEIKIILALILLLSIVLFTIFASVTIKKFDAPYNPDCNACVACQSKKMKSLIGLLLSFSSILISIILIMM